MAHARVEEDLVDQLFNSSEKRLARAASSHGKFRQGGKSRTHHSEGLECPSCAAKYEVVRVEAPPGPTVDRDITCVSCGAPLNGREGQLVLKYFLVKGKRRSSRRQAPRPT